MKWLCLGAGAIGTYIGGSLALAGETVVFVERPAALAELRSRGMRLDLSADRRRAQGVASLSPDELQVCASIEEALAKGPFDVGIYALKSFDTAAAVLEMAPFAENLPPIVCFSNGVDNEGELGRALGTDKVIAGTVTTAIGRRGPGDIALERLRGIGIHSENAISGEILRSAAAAGLNPRPYADAVALKWSKMLTNLVANPTSAILDMTAGQVMTDRGIYRIEIRMLRECLAVMRALGIRVVDLPRTPVRALAIAAQLPIWISKVFVARAAGGGRGGKMPSFHIDLHTGRGRSEVEYLHGAVVRAARGVGVATPVNEFLTQILVGITRGEIPRDQFAHNPAKLAAALEAFERGR